MLQFKPAVQSLCFRAHDAQTYFLVPVVCRPQPCKVLPVLQFLAIDTHGPLVALCDAHLMAAALHILARVLGGVHGCNNTKQQHSEFWCFFFQTLEFYSFTFFDVILNPQKTPSYMQMQYKSQSV